MNSARLLVEALRVLPEHLRGVDRQRAVHEDRDARQLSRLHHPVEIVHQLLRPSHRERRDDHLAAPFDRPPHHLAQLLVSQFWLAVRLIPVRALHDQVIRPLRQDRIAQQRQVPPADIPRKPQPEFATALLDIQHHRRRPQDVPGIHQLGRHPWDRLERLIVLHRIEILRHLRRILQRIDRLDWRRELVRRSFRRRRQDILSAC